MGSRPWKNALFMRLCDLECEGTIVVLTRPNGERVEGRYLGWTTRGKQQFMEINDAPEGHPIDRAFFSHSREVEVERGLLIDGEPAESYGWEVLRKRQSGGEG